VVTKALGEGDDGSLDGWRAGHERYLTRTGDFSREMALVSEGFALSEDLAAKGWGKWARQNVPGCQQPPLARGGALRYGAGIKPLVARNPP
jgi:hypothetical protein